MSEMKLKGVFKIEHIRKGETIGKYTVKNGIVDEGINAMLDIMFHAVTQIDPWYIGLIDNAGFTGLDPSDTMASHSGWSENDDYSETNRVEWAEDAASNKSITNSTPVTFTINATAAINGVFITSSNSKNGTTGKLWSTASFASVVNVQNGDELKITYTVNAAAA